MSNPIPISSAPSHPLPVPVPNTHQSSSSSRSFSHSYSHPYPFSQGSPGTSFSPTNPSPILSSALNMPGPPVGLSLTSSSFTQTRSFLGGAHPNTSLFYAAGSSPPAHLFPSTYTGPSSSSSSSSISTPASSARRSFSATSKPTLGLSLPSTSPHLPSTSSSSGSPPQKDCQWATAWASGINGSVAAGIKSPGLYGGSALADEDEDDDSLPGPLASSLPILTIPAASTAQKSLPQGPGPGPGAGPSSQTAGGPPTRRVSIAQPPQESSQRGQNVLRRLSLSSGSLLRPSIPAPSPITPPSSQPTTAISYSFPNATPGSGPSVQFSNSFEPAQHQPRPAEIKAPSVPSIGPRRKSVKSSGGKRAISPTGERMLVGHAGGGMF
ncbi:hypothetical protein [Phaffia rhodozyma]|uniref:Uncharacterized protein n=1 Tax=Phaffia rhodozyma TaxID=264483 RepID=A0A0F7SJX2_PHARH|nr:hypothetical protein [Phaffia rhodozyma]